MDGSGESAHDPLTRARTYHLIAEAYGWTDDYIQTRTFLQIHLHACMIIEQKMREAGQDPDAEPEPPKTLSTPADFVSFFGR